MNLSVTLETGAAALVTEWAPAGTVGGSFDGCCFDGMTAKNTTVGRAQTQAETIGERRPRVSPSTAIEAALATGTGSRSGGKDEWDERRVFAE